MNDGLSMMIVKFHDFLGHNFGLIHYLDLTGKLGAYWTIKSNWNSVTCTFHRLSFLVLTGNLFDLKQFFKSSQMPKNSRKKMFNFSVKCDIIHILI
jgi:hypothetical protein